MEQQVDEERGDDQRVPVAADFLIPLLGCALAGYYVVTTTDLLWEAKATGIFVGAVLVTLCVVHLARLILLVGAGLGAFHFGGLFNNTRFNRQRLGLLLLVAAFIVSIHWIGTTTGLFLVLIASMWLLGVRSLRALLGTAFATAATVYVLLIRLLGSHLPQGPLEHALGQLFGGG